ncbi:HlyD family secretion protein [Serratia sp. DD3]|uniref:HlyD family secretion protein n=1 Tax=Serratia sp. DD3 TaxID=1410619 RepID=UPI0004D46680|nr:HlyD family efflux transporter periplasmic adaptor subunit [Serratia sp. DD3]KEY60669.1 colicin V secretion protein CvaA [Serratia sp. DD3]
MTDKHAIFRREAIEHRAHSWLGNPQVITPVGASIWAVVALVIIVSLIAFMVIGTYTQRVRLTGSVISQPAVARITAIGNGTIVRSFAEEGRTIHAGDVIFIVNMETQTEYGATSHEITSALISQKATIEREIILKSEALDTERNFLLQLLDNKEAELQKMNDLISQSSQQTLWLLEKVEYFKKLVRQGIALETEYMARRAEYYSASVQLEAYKREKVKLQGESIDIKSRLAAIYSEVKVSLEILRRQSARLDQDLVSTEERRELHITSPIDGTLTGITGLVGNKIREAQELASVVPALGHAEVEIFATAEAIGELRKDQAVRLRFDAYPYQWFGQYDGIVTSISATSVEKGPETKGGQTNQQQLRYFQVRISPKSSHVIMAGKTYLLKPGIGVETDIFIRKRPLYEWILLPLKNIRTATQGGPGEETLYDRNDERVL